CLYSNRSRVAGSNPTRPSSTAARSVVGFHLSAVVAVYDTVQPRHRNGADQPLPATGHAAADRQPRRRGVVDDPYHERDRWLELDADRRRHDARVLRPAAIWMRSLSASVLRRRGPAVGYRRIDAPYNAEGAVSAIAKSLIE